MASMSKRSWRWVRAMRGSGTSPKWSIKLWRGGLLMQGGYGLFRCSVVCPLTTYILSGDSLLGDTNLDAIALQANGRVL